MVTASRRIIGIVQTVISGIAFGFIGVFGKAVYRAGVSPGELLSLRFVIAATALWVIVAFFVRGVSRQIDLGLVIQTAVLGILGYGVFSSFFFLALQGLSASLTVLLLYTYPVLVALGAFALWGEKMNRVQLLMLPVAVLGMILLVWGDVSVSEPWGILFGIGSAVFYSGYILASSRWLKGRNALVSVALIQTFAATALSAIHLHSISRVLAIVELAWPSLLAVALVSTVGAMTLFILGLQKLKSAEVSLLSTTEPLTAVIAAGIFLGERLSAYQLAGGAAILTALVILALKGRQNA